MVNLRLPCLWNKVLIGLTVLLVLAGCGSSFSEMLSAGKAKLVHPAGERGVSVGMTKADLERFEKWVLKAVSTRLRKKSEREKMWGESMRGYADIATSGRIALFGNGTKCQGYGSLHKILQG